MLCIIQIEALLSMLFGYLDLRGLNIWCARFIDEFLMLAFVENAWCDGRLIIISHVFWSKFRNFASCYTWIQRIIGNRIINLSTLNSSGSGARSRISLSALLFLLIL